MKPNRREFLTMAGAVGFACGRRLSAAEAPTRHDAKPVKSRIRVAQIKVYPQKGHMAANHRKLMGVLHDIEEAGKVDVVVTPGGALLSTFPVPGLRSGPNGWIRAPEPGKRPPRCTAAQSGHFPVPIRGTGCCI